MPSSRTTPAEAPVPKRRRADAERSVATILDAALEALASDPDASMAEIARRAGVVRATIYVHFPTRTELLDAVMAHAVGQVAEATRGAEPHRGEPVKALERVLLATWRELAPRGSEHALERLDRLAAVGLGAARRRRDLGDGVLHDGVEQRRTGGEVDVDGRPDDAGAASDLGHGGIGIARQRFQGGVEDGGDAAFGVGPAAPGGGRLGRRRRRFRHRQWLGSGLGLSRSFGTK